MHKTSTDLLGVRISRDVKAKLDELARATGRTRVHILNSAVAEYVKKHGSEDGDCAA